LKPLQYWQKRKSRKLKSKYEPDIARFEAATKLYKCSKHHLSLVAIDHIDLLLPLRK